jgi:polysaccharide biosynthesis protein PslH
MSMKPRALVVCFNRLLPSNQGNSRRIMQLVGFYQRQGFELDLLYHNEEGFDVSLSHALAKVFSRVTVVRSTAPKTIHPGHVCRIDEWYDAALSAAAREMHRLRGYSLAHANYIWYSPVLDALGKDVVKVLDTHDAFAERRAKYLAANMVPQWFSTSYEEEDAALRRADAALAIQKEEAAGFATRGHRNILYLPYVEPLVRNFEDDRPDDRPLTFGYLASGNDWNILSINDLLTKLNTRGNSFPHPIVVAGGVTKHVRDYQGVVKLGFVQQLHSFYDAVDVALNPMVGGTGLKIKTVEPLCYGKPVLSTRSGVEGVSHLWQMPIYEDTEAMAADMIRRFGRSEPEGFGELIQQAMLTRTALDSEYDLQLGRFSAWLKSRL